MVLLIGFLVFGGFLIAKYNEYQLNNPEDAVSFTKDYSIWLFGVGKKAVDITGAVIAEDWLPQNNTNRTNSSYFE